MLAIPLTSFVTDTLIYNQCIFVNLVHFWHRAPVKPLECPKWWEQQKLSVTLMRVTLGSYLKMGAGCGRTNQVIRGLELSVPPHPSLPPISGEERSGGLGPDGQWFNQPYSCPSSTINPRRQLQVWRLCIGRLSRHGSCIAPYHALGISFIWMFTCILSSCLFYNKPVIYLVKCFFEFCEYF